MSKRRAKSKAEPARTVVAAGSGDGWTDFSTTWGRPAIVALILISVATYCTYARALDGGLLWDDDAHIPRVELRSFDGLVRMWTDFKATQQYYPLLFSWFWLQFQLWGEHMTGYHIVNLLLHSGAAWLVYAIVRKLAIPGALLAAALFALHPVQVESVAWVTEQKNTLSGVFYLSAMLAYLHFDESRRRSWYVLALGLFVAALLSKTATVTLPATLLVIFWWSRSRDPEVLNGARPALSWRRDVLPLVPFFAVALVMGLVTVWIEHEVLGAKGNRFDHTWPERILLAGRAVWFYLFKLVWPDNLMMFYPRWELDAGDWQQWLYPLSVGAVLIALWAIRRRTRAPLAAALYFIGTLFPVLGLFNVYFFRFSLVADHFQYLPCLGPIVLASGATATWFGRLVSPWRTVAGTACVLLVVGLAALSWQQSALYGNVFKLYEESIQRNPMAWIAYNNLGVEYYQTGHIAEGMALLERAIEIDPTAPNAYANLAGALFEAGQIEPALEQYRQTIRKFPDFAPAYNNLGGTLLKIGRPQEAIEPLRKALEIQPDFADALSNLGGSLLNTGQAREAIPYLKQAIGYGPGIVEAHINLGIALAASGEQQAGVQSLKQAVSLRPTDLKAWANLAVEQSKLGRTTEAIAACERAIALAKAERKPETAAELQGLLRQYRAALGESKQP